MARSMRSRIPVSFVYPVFFLSGFAALLYQIVWQRALFTIYGTSTESVTIVVTAFMLGLGFGNLAGGALSKDPDRPLPLIFAVAELGIGAFGLISLRLFAWAGASTTSATGLQIGLFSFALVLVPTLLMGATLPLLVSHLVQEMKNVGRSVGVLYFVNTLGSAAGSIAAAVFLLGALGMAASVWVAAGANATVAGVVFLLWIAGRKP